jgi:hypothetical protein
MMHPKDVVTKEFLVYLNERYRHRADLEVIPEVEEGEEAETFRVTVPDYEPEAPPTALLLRAVDEAGLAPGPYWEFDGAVRQKDLSNLAWTVRYKRLQVFGATDMWPSQCPNCGRPCRDFIDLRDEGHDAVLMECGHDQHPPGCGYRWIEEEGD